jgi:3-dehydroquinate dehydratase II
LKERVEVLHGVNFDVLGRRPAAHYGGLTLEALELQVKRYADDLGLAVAFSQTNHEGEYCEALHNSTAHRLILNPGAWTHYSWAIRDALELVGLPAVEVHLSAVDEREEWRRTSVIRDLCMAVVAGKGVEGYRDALGLLAERLGR